MLKKKGLLIMNFSEALELLKQGKGVERSCWGCNSFIKLNKDIVYLYNDFGDAEFILDLSSLLAQDWEEYKEPLLTKEEKEYLKMIIKFSPGEVDFVSLERLSSYKDYDYNMVWLTYRDGDRHAHYVGEDYFKNLEEGKGYALKELGLDE